MAQPTFKLLPLYYALKESFWFLPALMAFGAVAAALGGVALDRHLGSGWIGGTWLVWSGGADGARSVLTVIAGSTMTVVSIVFSITITALAQTSSQFGPRVLRNFTRDRANQAVLGVFVASFLFSLLVLRTVRSEDGEAFVPYASVNVGIALAVLSMAVLIFFIHHIATSIQADLLIARVGDECQKGVETMFPQMIGRGAEPPADTSPDAAAPTEPADVIASDAIGYVQAVDADVLFAAARRVKGVIVLEQRPGRFVTPGQPLARVKPQGRVDDEVVRLVREAIHLGERRTPDQDLSYVAQELVEIAARALSPGVNEPFTAMLCIDWLGAALRSLAGRSAPSALRQDETGNVRVIGMPLTFAELVRGTIGMIRRYADRAPDVQIALLRTLRDLAPAVRRDADRAILLEQVRQIGLDALGVRNERDRSDVLAMASEARRALTVTTVSGDESTA